MPIMSNWPFRRGCFDSSSLRNLPMQFDKHKRMILEACGYAGDAIELSMGRLYDTLLSVQSRLDNDCSICPARAELNAIFVDAWSTADQLHTLGRLLSSVPELNENASVRNFLCLAGNATELRNYMNHLEEMLKSPKGNIVAKSQMPPLFGAISFSWFSPHRQKAGTYVGHDVVFLPASGRHHKQTLSATYNESLPRTAPIDDVVLYGSDKHLNLTVAVSSAIMALNAAASFAQSELNQSMVLQDLSENDLIPIDSTAVFSCVLEAKSTTPLEFLEVKDNNVETTRQTVQTDRWQVVNYPCLTKQPSSK
jgi:hypothetical protein